MDYLNESLIAAFDVEASGTSFTKNGIISIGATLMKINHELEEISSFQVNVSLFEGRTYEESCLKNFWFKHPEAYALVNKNPLPPKEAIERFSKFLGEIDALEARGAKLWLVSNNPSFDIAWLDMYLSLFTDRKPIAYSSVTGEYRMIWDSASIQKT